MLKTIYVDGLRSLREFDLELQPGLNVLIGPNGSGKSNILLAFELISKLSHLDIPGVYGLLKGPQHEVASLFDLNRDEKKITIKLVGEINSPLNNSSKSEKNNVAEIEYMYECEIDFKFNQEIKLEFSRQYLELKTQSENKKNSFKFVRIGYDKDKIVIHEISDIFLRNKKQINNKNQLESYINMNSGVFKYRSLFFEFQQIFIPLVYIFQELNSCICFNIDPNVTRISLQQPIFPNYNPNGLGLSHALYCIYEERDKDGLNEVSENLPNLNYKDIYSKINSYFCQLLPEIKELEIHQNKNLNLIETNVKFKNGETVPLINMSDGTLKLLSLLVSILTKQHMFILEEPENYLHPKMQHLLADLMRSSLKFRQSTGIFSTHSESFINSLDPSEVILTNFKDGHTKVSRIDSMDSLRESLQDSGFGLSWYYVTGALDD